MKILNNIDPFPFIVIDNFYSDNELELIWNEINFLSQGNKLKAAKATGGNINAKKNLGIFVENVFLDHSFSNILNIGNKIFENKNSLFCQNKSWFFCNFSFNESSTLLSYYENSDYYKPHKDLCHATNVTWLYREPKKFEGGEFYFPDFNIDIKSLNNRSIIFPSCINHAVKPVKMNSDYKNKNMGRFSITKFILSNVILNVNPKKFENIIHY